MPTIPAPTRLHSIRLTLLDPDGQPCGERVCPFYKPSIVDHKAIRHALDVLEGLARLNPAKED